MSNQERDHFEGKGALAHLKEAQAKGKKASSEIHGAEPSGFVTAFSDSAREASLLLALLLILLNPLSLPFTKVFLFLSVFAFGFILWKAGRSAYFGWARIERVNRLIKEENEEILHNRSQEKEELIEIYKARGFKGKLLEDTVEVLMADDNRLLQVMLEEELGLPLEVLQHPLQLSFGAFLGSFIAAILSLSAIWFFGLGGALTALFFITLASGIIFAKNFKNDVIKGYIWNLALIFLSLGASYFLHNILYGIFVK